jgi:hypothetical protein
MLEDPENSSDDGVCRLLGFQDSAGGFLDCYPVFQPNRSLLPPIISFHKYRSEDQNGLSNSEGFHRLTPRKIDNSADPLDPERVNSCPLPQGEPSKLDIYPHDLSQSDDKISHPLPLPRETTSSEVWIKKERKTHSREKWGKKRGRHRSKDQFSLIDHRIDPGSKIVRNKKDMIFKMVKDVDWRNTTPQRAGVIVYTVHKEKLYFGLGVDLIHNNITDFGGQVKYFNDKNAVIGGLREFREETHNVFGEFHPNQVQECKVAIRTSMIIIFVPLNIYPEKVSKHFLATADDSSDREIKEIIWLTKREFLNSIKLGTAKITRPNGVENIKIYDLLSDFLFQLVETFPHFVREL